VLKTIGAKLSIAIANAIKTMVEPAGMDCSGSLPFRYTGHFGMVLSRCQEIILAFLRENGYALAALAPEKNESSRSRAAMTRWHCSSHQDFIDLFQRRQAEYKRMLRRHL
jgi:hypothetical protein